MKYSRQVVIYVSSYTNKNISVHNFLNTNKNTPTCIIPYSAIQRDYNLIISTTYTRLGLD